MGAPVFRRPLTSALSAQIRFRVALNALLDCLNVFGLAAQPVTSLSLAFSEEDSKLFMLLEEGGVTAESTVMTVDAGEEADYDAAFRLRASRGATWLSFLRRSVTPCLLPRPRRVQDCDAL